MNKKILLKKGKAINHFIEKISRVPERKLVKKIILFGSVARGNADRESDIDLMVFGKEPNKIRKLAGDMSFDILTDLGELIEPHVYPSSDLIRPRSYFVLRAIETGKEVYPNHYYE
jgi:predicted nucleotidyltransferase